MKLTNQQALQRQLFAFCLLVGCMLGESTLGRRGLKQTATSDGPKQENQASPSSPAGRVIPLIAFGLDAELGEFPYMASCRKPNTMTHYCGGALIAPNIVLTAAHCVAATNGLPPPPKFPFILLGGLFRENGQDPPDSKVEVFKSCKRIVHPNWNGDLLNGFDIAIIRLNRSTTAAPAMVNQDRTLDDGALLTAIGFGSIGNRKPATILQKTDRLMYVSNDECANLSALDNGAQLPILDSMMCAFDPEGSDACQGDSGGPLLLDAGFGFGLNRDGERKDLVVGITSFGPEKCEDLGRPAIYTRTSSHFEWIAQTLKDLENPEFMGAEENEECAEPQMPPTDNSEPSPPPSGGVTAQDIVNALADGDVDKATSLIIQAVQEAETAGDADSDIVAEAMQIAMDRGLRRDAGTALLQAIRSDDVTSENVRSAFFVLNGGR